MRPFRLTGLVLVLMLLAAACGQKDGVALSARGGGAGTGGGAGFGGEGAAEDFVPGEAEPVDPAAPVEPSPGDAGAPAAPAPGAAPKPGGSGQTTGGGGAPSGETSGGTPAPAAGPNDKNGVSEKELVIGIHAPVTGAAPFPQAAFEESVDVYWNAKGPVHGRQVKIVFRNDEFNPSRAVQVCREMVEKHKVFLLVGGGGADQITACAKYANQVGVPYLSSGVNQNGLENLKTYFALSLTYAQQSPVLATLVKNKLGKTKIAIVVADTSSFADARASMAKASTDAGLEIVYNKTIPKNASQSESLTAAREVQASGAEAVYFLTAPTVFFQFAQQASGQGYNPQYVGPGISGGLNDVAKAGCPGIGEARFLSPFPQLDDPTAAEYQAAYKRQHNKEGGDIGFALWGLNALLSEMFNGAGKDLGRAKFMATLQSGQPFGGSIYPQVKYAPGKPFGGTAMHLLKANCASTPPVYVTEAKNVSRF